MKQRVFLVGALWLMACGARPEPAKSAEPEPEPAAPSAAAEPAAAPGTPTPSTAAPAADSTGPSTPAASSAQSASEASAAADSTETAKPSVPSLHDLCFAMCDKVKAKCPRSAFEACQVNCTKYDPAPDGCDAEVRAALSCAGDAKDLVCANVAPESCAKPFRRLAACAAGEKPPEASTPTKAALPPGFAQYENAAEGIRAPMPEGVKAGSGDVIASATTADGAVYSIRKLPRPEGKLNAKAFLKLGLSLFGRCSDKMKLQGMVEKPGRTSINYATTCPDGSEERGIFWASDQALYMAGVKGPAGKLGPTDTFLYGFAVE